MTGTTTTPRGLTSLRTSNRRLVITELQRHTEISRAALARATGLSGTTVSSLVAELVGEGMVAESGGHDRARTGRPGRLLRLVAGRELVAGVDLAHDSIRVALSDLAGGVIAERAVRFDIDGRGPASLAEVARLLEELIDGSGVDRDRVVRLVVGLPGLVDHVSGSVESPRMEAWESATPAATLTELTGFPASAENDADLAVMGERMFGAAKGLDDVVYVKVSAGIGAGLVLGGRLYRASRGGAGEIGHIQVREDGAICHCGNRGCLETVATVPVALRLLGAANPETATPDDLIALLDAGDRAAVRVITDVGREIGRALADLCNVLAPQALIIGGDLAGSARTMIDAIAAAVNRYTLPRVAAGVRVDATALGHRAGVLGAVALAIDSHPLLSP
jgi:predicted NBD/HSP70 family sugar kinase